MILNFDQILAFAETNKFLGLHVESKVSWTSHTNILLTFRIRVSCI
jgi:hypothetical protein